MFCNSCGAEIAGDARFCTKCGKQAGVTSAAEAPSSVGSVPQRGGGMKIAGGILGILGGLFGVGAAIVTLFFGGLGAAVGAESGNSVIGLGWGGLFFSFLALIFAAVAFARPRGAGLGLMISAVLGMFLGGTIVAMCMLLSLVGGVLAFIDGKRGAAASGASKSKKALWIGGAAVLAIFAIVSLSEYGKKGADSAPEDPWQVLESAQPSALSPSGELADLFQLGGEHTDIQRESKFAEIKGQIVSWCLPVFDVSKSGDGYKVQTKTKVSLFDSSEKMVGAFVFITPRNESEKAFVEGLKEGDVIPFKGYIKDTTVRSFDIEPAILQSGGSCAGGLYLAADAAQVAADTPANSAKSVAPSADAAQAAADAAAAAGDAAAADAALAATSSSRFEGGNVAGAPLVGSVDPEHGYFLLRELMDEPYWTDWYGMGGDYGMEVKAVGKMMFEGTLLIDCVRGTSEWRNLDEYSNSDIVPAAAIDNAKKIFCSQ